MTRTAIRMRVHHCEGNLLEYITKHYYSWRFETRL